MTLMHPMLHITIFCSSPLRVVTVLSQVRHAEEAGAAAAIVYDDTYEPLIIMSKPAGHPSPGIPSVFVSQKSGIIMKKLLAPGVTIAHIMPVRSYWLALIFKARPEIGHNHG